MTPDEILTFVNQSLSSVTNNEVNVGLDAHLLESEVIDSLDAVQFLFELEDKFGCKFPDGDLNDHGLYKVGALVDYIAANVGSFRRA